MRVSNILKRGSFAGGEHEEELQPIVDAIQPYLKENPNGGYLRELFAAYLQIMEKRFLEEHEEDRDLKWLVDIGKESVYKRGYRSCGIQAIADETDCLDHTFLWGDCLVSEPYDLGIKQLADLAAFCQKHNLTFGISGGSLHYPNRTMRLTIAPKEGKETVSTSNY